VQKENEEEMIYRFDDIEYVLHSDYIDIQEMNEYLNDRFLESQEKLWKLQEENIRLMDARNGILAALLTLSEKMNKIGIVTD